MKNITSCFVLFLLLSSQSLFSQIDWGLVIQPGYVFTLHNNTDDLGPNEKELVDQFDAGSASYAIAIMAGKAIAPRTNIQVGLGYSQQGYQYSLDQPLTIWGHEENYDRLEVDYHFLQLPIQIQQQLSGNEKQGLLASIGCSPSFTLVRKRTEYYSTLEEEIVHNGTFHFNAHSFFRYFHFPVHFGFQYRLPLGNKLLWEVGPTVSYDFSGLIGNVGLDYNRHFLQLQLSNYFWFN